MDASSFFSINQSLNPLLFQSHKDNILKNKQYLEYLFYRNDKKGLDSLIDAIKHSKNQREFILNPVIKHIYPAIIRNTTDGVKVTGCEYLKKDEAYLFVTTHRDISLDCLVTSCELASRGYIVPFPVVGTNLFFSPFAQSCFYMLGSTAIDRTLSVRELYSQSILISSYINYALSTKYSSIWIAGGAGRSKDGVDIVKPSLIKMLFLSQGKNVNLVELLNTIKIVPVSISYEKDPNDILKAYQIATPNFKKTSRDDDIAIQKGIVENKGRVGMSISRPLDVNMFSQNFTFDDIAKKIQDDFQSSYCLFPTNFCAYDIVFQTKKYKKFYDDTTIDYFRRFKHLPSDLKKIAIMIYANPVLSKEKLGLELSI